MSMYGIQCGLIDEWIRKRAAALGNQWGDEVYNFIRGAPWEFSVNVRLQAAASQQAHAECLAHLCGQPVPDGKEVLADLLAWLDSPTPKHGGFSDLPNIIGEEYAQTPAFPITDASPPWA